MLIKITHPLPIIGVPPPADITMPPWRIADYQENPFKTFGSSYSCQISSDRFTDMLTVGRGGSLYLQVLNDIREMYFEDWKEFNKEIYPNPVSQQAFDEYFGDDDEEGGL